LTCASLCFPDAAQRETVRRCSGIVVNSVFGTIPGLQRTISLRHSASKTRVNALLLRCARETRLHGRHNLKMSALSAA